MQFTTAFAPSDDDLAEDFFGLPVMTMRPPQLEADDAEDSLPEDA